MSLDLRDGQCPGRWAIRTTGRREVGAQDNYREGYGRTQRILTEHIAEHAGFLLDWHRISPVEQNQVMAQAFEGEIAPLHDALERAVLPIFRGGAVDESPWPTEPTGPGRAPNFWQLARTGQQVLAEARDRQPDPAEDAGPPAPSRGPEHGLDR